MVGSKVKQLPKLHFRFCECFLRSNPKNALKNKWIVIPQKTLAMMTIKQ